MAEPEQIPMNHVALKMVRNSLQTEDLKLHAESMTINLSQERITSVIAASTTSTGDITSSEGYRIDGKHKGNISATTIFITEDASVEGILNAKRIIVQGSVRGQIKANEVVLTNSAHVFGKITYKEIATFKGFVFEGEMYLIKPGSV